MATAYLLSALQALQHNFAITVIGQEHSACYNRVLLSGLLAGEVQEADLGLLSTDCDAMFMTGVVATGIDLAERQVFCDTGESLAFDQLVLATGANVAMPPGLQASDNVRVLRSVEDVAALRELSQANISLRAVVLGGGLLGLEAAHGLNQLGMDTTVLHRNTVLMNRQLDADGSAYLRQMLEQRGLTFRIGASIRSLHYTGDGAPPVLELDDGSRVESDLLVMATGIVPRIELAQPVLACDRGILVDAQLRTSEPLIYALGECCQLGNQTFGLVAPVREQADVLAHTLCSLNTTVAGPVFSPRETPVQLKISGIDIFRAGEIDGDAESIVLQDPANGIYRRLALRNNRLVGALLIGDKRGGNWFGELISSGQDVTHLRRGLLFGREVAEAMNIDIVAHQHGEAA
ncbi:MAG: hypothetical protein Hals2KO_16030 [Halioglobus sp.]